MKSRKSLTVLAVCVGLTSCNLIFADFTIVNETEHELGAVSMRLGDTERRLGDIPPHSDKRFRGVLKGEGAPILSYTLNGKRVEFATCYHTPGMPVRGEARVGPEGPIRNCGTPDEPR
jgi:hypothetical protein